MTKGEASLDQPGDEYPQCYEAALHYIEYRPRSEAEVRRHLMFKRRFTEKSVSRAVAKLKQLKLIDDTSFSEMWARERVAHRHKSSLMIKRELMQKGVDGTIIESVTGHIDDEANALRAGMSKARHLKDLDYPEFYKRLAAYLGRKGYGSELVRGVVVHLWECRKDDAAGK
ncbi:MAG: regulatory protein RecX [Dehalococcoidia bacterium]|nr:regulatory protein RecX [Dehalococcoidia bacterium]